MTVETATYISDLNASYPAPADPESEGANHMRLIKSVLKATFAGVVGAVTITTAQLNALAGISSASVTALSSIPTTVLTALSTTTQAAVQAALTAFGASGQITLPGGGTGGITSTTGGVAVTQGTAGFQLGTDGSFALLGQAPRFIANGQVLGSIPLGGIILWSGSPSAIPSGWSICNGANGTPNLAGTIIQAVAPGSAVNGASTIIANVNTSSTTVTFNVWELYYIMRLA